MTQEIDEFIKQAVDSLDVDTPRATKKAVAKYLTEVFVDGKDPKEAFGMTPAIEERLYNHGYQLFQSGKYKLAAGIFHFLRRFDTKSVTYAFSLAACQQYLQRYEEAAANYVDCNFLDPENPVPYFHLYACYMKLNLPMPALIALETIVNITETNIDFAPLRERVILERKELLKSIHEKDEAKIVT